MQPKNLTLSAGTRASSSGRLWPLPLLAVILTGCAAHSPAPYYRTPPPAVLREPESSDLASYSERVRAWLKKAGDTLNPSEQTGKP